MIKTCASCGKDFPALRGWKNCSQDCSNASLKLTRKRFRDREQSKQYSRDYYANNRTKCREAGEASRQKYRKIVEKDEMKRITMLVNSCRNSAIKRNLDFNLSKEIIYALMMVQNRRCALTDLEFEWHFVQEYRCNPFAPSIDRINSRKGYTIDNIQIVCYVVNLAKNEYPTDLFDQICLARVTKINA